MIITLDTELDYSEANIEPLAASLSDLSMKDKREVVITFLSGRMSGSADPLKSIGKKRGNSKSSRTDFTYALLEELEKEFIRDDDPHNLLALKNIMDKGEIITNKFGKPCYISEKLIFNHDDELFELFTHMGSGEIVENPLYLFKHEREALRASSQDKYIRMMDTVTSGSRLEWAELNPNDYKVFYCIDDTQGMPQFVFDKAEKRFVNYRWGQPNAFLRPFHESTRGVDMTKKLLTRNNDNNHTLEVCIEFGCKKTEENNFQNKKREWRPFSEYWYNSSAVMRETESIQGVVPVNIREMKKMTVPDINSSIITDNPNAIPMDLDSGYDDVAYNRMVNFNPQKILVQIASNDKKGLGLRDSEDVTVNQRLKAAEILYNRLTRTKPVQKQAKSDNEDSSHVVVTFPEKEGYADEGKKRLKVGTDEAQAVLDFVTNSYSKEEDGEYVEV